jgi:DNA-binding CsgD family transcriptional regulator
MCSAPAIRDVSTVHTASAYLAILWITLYPCERYQRSVAASPAWPAVGATEATVADSADRPIRTLTAREREVLQQAAFGLSNREIGEQLQIAEQTVKNHLSSAMRKLEIHDRTHAVVLALGSGWIALPVGRDVARVGEGVHAVRGEHL